MKINIAFCCLLLCKIESMVFLLIFYFDLFWHNNLNGFILVHLKYIEAFHHSIGGSAFDIYKNRELFYLIIFKQYLVIMIFLSGFIWWYFDLWSNKLELNLDQIRVCVRRSRAHFAAWWICRRNTLQSQNTFAYLQNFQFGIITSCVIFSIILNCF